MFQDDDALNKAANILKNLPRHRVADGRFWESLGCFLIPLFTRLSKLVTEKGGSSTVKGDLSTDKPFAEITIDFGGDVTVNSPYWRIEGELNAEEVMVEYHDGAWPKGPRRDRMPVQQITQRDLGGSLTRWIEHSVSIHLRDIRRGVLWRSIFNPWHTVIDKIKRCQYWSWLIQQHRQNVKIEIGNIRAHISILIKDRIFILSSLLFFVGFIVLMFRKDRSDLLPLIGFILIIVAAFLSVINVISEIQKNITPKYKLLLTGGLAILVAIVAIISLVYANLNIEQVTRLSADSFPEAQSVISIVYQAFWFSLILLLPSWVAFLAVPAIGLVLPQSRIAPLIAVAVVYIVFVVWVLVFALPTLLERYLDQIIVFASFQPNESSDGPLNVERRICTNLSSEDFVNFHEGNRVIVAKLDESRLDEEKGNSPSKRYIFKDFGENCSAADDSSKYPSEGLPQAVD